MGRKLQSVPQAGVSGECTNAKNRLIRRTPTRKAIERTFENFAYKLCSSTVLSGARTSIRVGVGEDRPVSALELRRLREARTGLHA